MEAKYVIAYDPSFDHFGISIIDVKNRNIMTKDLHITLGSHEFINVALKSEEQVNNVIETVNDMGKLLGVNSILGDDCSVIGMENALPWGYSATDLMALDTELYRRMNPIKTAVFSVTYLKFIMGAHKKKDSINLANGIINILCNEFKYSYIEHSNKISDGEAESFIYAVRMFIRTNPDLEETKRILEIFPLFNEKKEKYVDEFIF